MGIFAVILIAIGLCFDILAVTLSLSCTSCSRIKFPDVLKIVVIFVIFHISMTFAGYLIGTQLGKIEVIAKLDHWLAFGLLAIIGGNMIISSIRETDKQTYKNISTVVLLTLAFATSIDALATGISFAFALEISIWTTLLIIGVVTAVISVIGLYAGTKIKCFLGSKVEIFGGIILIAIGIKVAVEHTIGG